MNTPGPSEIQEAVAALLAAEALPPIIQAGHPVLRRKAMPYEGQFSEPELHALISLMRKVMHEAPGVGLAAPQIGIPLQLAVIEDLFDIPGETARTRERTPLPLLVMMNPEYTAVGSEVAAFYEGCLSLHGLQAVVERPRRVRLDYDDLAGRRTSREFSGWPARIVQHETDHLGGTLYIDKAFTRSLATNAEYAQWWAHPGIEEARRQLGF